jgi:hypothetical protein
MPHNLYTSEEKNTLREYYGKVRVKVLSEQMNRAVKSIEKKALKMGLSSKGGALYTGNPCAKRAKMQNHPHWRKPGQPWEANGRVYFREGEDSEVVIYTRYLWAKNHGQIPKGHHVIHLDRNPKNCALSNLSCISQEENMKRNSIHRHGPEVYYLSLALSKLNKTIKKISNEE